MGGAALRLSNARNITWRTDKDAAFVGTGVYVTLREMKMDGSSYMKLFQPEGRVFWTGAAGSRVDTAQSRRTRPITGHGLQFPH